MPTNEPSASPRLIVTHGREVGRVYELNDYRITIGRDPGSKVHFDEPSVSTRHAEIFIVAGRIMLHDHGSTNGTEVNGQPATEAELHDGDEVKFGDVVTRLRTKLPESVRAPVPVAVPVPEPVKIAPPPAAPIAAPAPVKETAPMLAPLPAEFRARAGEEPEEKIFDQRSLLGGVAVLALLLAVAVLWKLKPAVAQTLRRIEDFQFSVAEPTVEKFDLKEPVRAVVQERTENIGEAMEQRAGDSQISEMPDIHMTTVASAEPSAHVFIQSPNVDVSTAKIDVPATAAAVARDVADIIDAPTEITQPSEETSWALQPIAAVTAGPADIFRYKDPTPADRTATYYINTGPRPGRPMKFLPKAFGEQDKPSMGTVGAMNINLFGTGEFFKLMGGRGGSGGGLQARTAVDSALHWIAIHQDPDGMWRTEKNGGTEDKHSLGETGLATLALLGGGNTPRKGEYQRNVSKALEAILRCQRSDGLFEWKGGNLYTHGICTIAVSEAYGRSRDERLGAAAQKALTYCEKAVNSDGGWRYVPKSDVSDMSVTAWFVQAIKTAKLAQLKYSEGVFAQALTFLDSCTDQGGSRDSTGGVGYTFEANQQYGSGHRALTAAGMLIRQFSGVGVKNHLLVKGAALTRREAPEWKQKDFYYWYYATYAMHNMGEENRIWWNSKIRDVLLTYQSREGDNAGSWDPKGDAWGGHGISRVYTTSLGALCLEVYYRYSEALTSFGVAPDIDELLLE